MIVILSTNRKLLEADVLFQSAFTMIYYTNYQRISQ